MGIRDKPIAPASPWQNSYAERLIGTIRRECLDHVIMQNPGNYWANDMYSFERTLPQVKIPTLGRHSLQVRICHQPQDC
jgi:hypothetical protein